MKPHDGLRILFILLLFILLLSSVVSENKQDYEVHIFV